MSYFTALVVRLGLYFWGLPLPLRARLCRFQSEAGKERRGAKNNSNTQQNSAALHEDDIPFRQLSQCFRTTNSMLWCCYLNALVLITQCFDAAISMLL